MYVDDSVPDECDAANAERVELGDDALDALSSKTARRVVSVLCDGPAVASAVAEDADVSIQVASYHLDQLRAAGVVTVVGTARSEKGKRMDVYGLAAASIVFDLCEEGDA